MSKQASNNINFKIVIVFTFMLQAYLACGSAKLAIIGDFNPNSELHLATNQAISHSCKLLNASMAYNWIATEKITENFDHIVHNYDAFLIAPGMHKSLTGTLQIIEYARLNNIPTLGTCGGFQHMVLEFAKNVLNIKNAEHAELNPNGTNLVISALSCNIRGQVLKVKVVNSLSTTFFALKADSIREKFYCNFGINPLYQSEIDKHGFKVVGIGEHEEARILELENHTFFIATLFVPQINSTEEKPHNLITAFIETVLAH